MKTLTLTLLALSTSALAGCHITASTPSGLREYHRGLNGLVVTGKSAPNVEDQYHKTQRDTDYNALQRLQESLSKEMGS